MQRKIIDVKSARVRAAVIAAIKERGPAALVLDYIGTIETQSIDWEAAFHVGAARTALNTKRGRRDGQSRDTDVETEAALCEAIVSQLLEDTDAHLAPLVAFKPPTEADIVLEGIVLDIKTVRRRSPCVSINECSHRNKAPAFYVVCHIVAADINLYVIKAAAVDSWPLRTTAQGQPMPEARHYRAVPLPPPLDA